MSISEKDKLVWPEERNLKLRDETKELICSLPLETDWMFLHIHQYQGFWIQTGLLQQVLDFQNHFIAQPTDVVLVTTPKSGTTWLKALVFSLVHRGQYQNNENHPLLTNHPHTLVPFSELTSDFTNLPSPRVFSSHLPTGSLPKSIVDASCKIVYLCRDPKDTFVSLWHFANKLRPKELGSFPIEDAFDLFCRGVSIFGPFWDQVLGYWRESLNNPDRVFFLKYEEMKEQPEIHLKKLARFLDCPFSAEEEKEGVVGDILKLCSFDSLRGQKVDDTYFGDIFYRRGVVGDWINHMTPEMGQKLDEITEQKVQGSGLRF